MNERRRGAIGRALDAVKRIDRAVGRLDRRRRVLIEVRTPMNLAVLRPVFERLLDDRRIVVRFTGHVREDLQSEIDRLGLADRVVSRRRAAWSRVDLYMNADPWEAVPLHRARRHLNFFHGVAGKYDLDCPSGLPLGFDRYDKVAFPNAGRMQRYLDAGIVTRTQAALIGYPKADLLATTSVDRRAVAADLGLDPARPTAIYAPTFSAASSLGLAGEAIVETLLGCGCNVIAKLHDRSLDPDPKYSGGIDWRRRLARFSEMPRAFVLADSGDSTRYVQASDLMVTDHSSIGFEFCVLDRPLVVYDAPALAQTARIDPEKLALLRSAAIVVRDPSELRRAVGEALGTPGAQAPGRARAAAEVFYRPGGATDRALALIYGLLELAPAAEVAVPRPAGAWSGAE